MNFAEILGLPDKTVIPEFQGRVVKVYEPYRPSPAQDRHGIHKQPIILQNDAGQNLSVDILKKELHLPFTAEGEVWVFKSMPKGGNGDLEGVSVSRWQGDKGEQFSVEIRQGSHFYAKDGAPKIQIFRPTHRHEVEFMCEILSAFEDKLGTTAVWERLMHDPKALTSAVDTIYLECSRNGVKSEWMQARGKELGMGVAQPQSTPAPAPSQKTTTAPAKPLETPAPAAEGPPSDESPESQIALMAYSGIATEKIQACISKAMTEAPKWERVMDSLFAMLQHDGVQLKHIHAAYDTAKRKMQEARPEKKVTDESVCRNIALQYQSFKVLLEAAKDADAPAPGSIGDNDSLAPIE